ncbi:MAG: hypothetical protein ACREBH_04090 [Candidatus Micrarchaeaceae archaeon]
MNVGSCIKRLHDIEAQARALMCEYCGTETLGMGDMCMCSNCESMVLTDRSTLQAKDAVLLDSLDSISKLIGDSSYKEAMEIYDKMIAERNEPSLMYAAAVALFRYSNYEIMQINYMSKGFMDENAIHRSNASKLISSAKKLLAKSISIANKEIAGGIAPLNLLYNRFLSQVKMGNSKGAKESLDALIKSNNEYVSTYSSMLFESYIGRYGNVVEIADKLTTEKSFSVNAFYYIGLALFKTRDAGGAKKILYALRESLKSDSLDALILEVDYQTATLK